VLVAVVVLEKLPAIALDPSKHVTCIPNLDFPLWVYDKLMVYVLSGIYPPPVKLLVKPTLLKLVPDVCKVPEWHPVQLDSPGALVRPPAAPPELVRETVVMQTMAAVKAATKILLGVKN